MNEMELESKIQKIECILKLLEFWNQKDLCVANTWLFKKKKRKVTFSSGGIKTEIDFVLVEKESRKFLKDVKVIPWKLQHKLVVVDIKKVNLFKYIKIKQNMQWRVWKLKEKETSKKFKDKVKELVNIEAKDLWGLFKVGVLEAYEKLCGKRNKGE